MANWWLTHNHLGTVHAIASCNLAEYAMGVLAEAAVPASHRWIPMGMEVRYLATAKTSVTAEARWAPAPPFGPATEAATVQRAARFGARRVASALVRRGPSPAVDPLRAHGRATIASALLAALALGAAAVVGALDRPADWRRATVVVAERSGALAVVTRDPPGL